MSVADPPAFSGTPDLNVNAVVAGGEAVNLSSTDASPTYGTPVGTARALYVGVSGDVKVDFPDGTTGVTLTAMAGGVWHPIAVTKVYKTGTTATNLTFGY